MARVNLPPIKIPQKLLQDPELKGFFEAQAFALFQLFERTGGGSDIIEGNQEQVDQNTADILINSANIELNSIAISQNIIDISTNATNIATNTDDIAELKQTFSWKTIPTGEEVTIGINQQMILADGINVDGSLVIDGELAII